MEQTGGEVGPPQLRIPDVALGIKTNESLSDVEQARFDGDAIRDIVQAVVDHYGVPICFVALESKAALQLKACHGLNRMSLPIDCIAQHSIARALPIVIEDTHEHPRLAADTLIDGPPHARFYAGAPLMVETGKCVGTLCIMDVEPRAHFGLSDCAVLTQAAETIAQIFKATGCESVSAVTHDSLVSVGSYQGNELDGHTLEVASALVCPHVHFEGDEEVAGVGYLSQSPESSPEESLSGSVSGAIKTNESLPELIHEHFDCSAMQRIVQAVVQHYNVPVCFVALESPRGLKLRGRHGLDRTSAPLDCIARHSIHRALPIIVEDTGMHKQFSDDPFVIGPPYARFYAGAPLVVDASTCTGTLCIMDVQPRIGFSLSDCDVLTRAAQAAVDVFIASCRMNLSAFSVDSLPSVPEDFADGCANPAAQGVPFVVVREPASPAAASFGANCVPHMQLFRPSGRRTRRSLSRSNGASPALSVGTKTNESLPDIVQERFDDDAVIQKVVQNVIRHYAVPVCFVALEAQTELRLKARHGLDRRTAPLECIARHGISRALPIIVEDTKAHARMECDPFVAEPPYARFYVGAPLMIEASKCVGTLCIMDVQPRANMELKDCAVLIQAAQRVVEAYLAGYRRSASAWSMDSLVSLQDTETKGDASPSFGPLARSAILQGMDILRHCSRAGTPVASLGTKTNESLPDMAQDHFDAEAIRRVVQAAVDHYKVPVCFVALESPEGLRLKAPHGLDRKAVPFHCIAHHSIARALPIIIEDTSEHARFKDDPLVTGPPHARFYAGAPLMVKAGTCVGTFCIMDAEPRVGFGLRDCEVLSQLAQVVVDVCRSNCNRTMRLLSMESLPSMPESPRSGTDEAPTMDLPELCGGGQHP